MPDPVHGLLGGPALTQCRIACAAPAATCASLDRRLVTCPACLQTLRRPTTAGGGMPEKQLQELVRQACQLTRWMYYHCHTSQHSPSGYPDVTAVRGERLLVAELKRHGALPTPEQQRWLDALRQVRQVEVHLWTPDDIPTILEVLR